MSPAAIPENDQRLAKSANGDVVAEPLVGEQAWNGRD
jgi:hypothetical protein